MYVQNSLVLVYSSVTRVDRIFFHMSDAPLMMRKGRDVVICRSREELMQTWWWGLRVKIFYMLKTLEVSKLIYVIARY